MDWTASCRDCQEIWRGVEKEGILKHTEHIQYENKNEDRNEMSKKIRGSRESERK